MLRNLSTTMMFTHAISDTTNMIDMLAKHNSGVFHASLLPTRTEVRVSSRMCA